MEKPILSVIEMNKMLAELKAYCSKHFELSQLANLEENLQSLIQKRQDKKSEFLRIVEEQLVLGESQKQPDDWLTLEAAETQLSKSKESCAQAKDLSKKTERIEDIVDVASDALHILREKLCVLEAKIMNLEEKQAQLNGSPETSNKTMQTFNVQSCAMKLSELLSSAQAERDILRKSVQRMEDTLKSVEKLSSSQSSRATAVRNELSKIEEKLKELEKLSGMTCCIKGSSSVEIELLSDDSLGEESSSKVDVSATPDDDVRLKVTFTFRENEQKGLRLENVQTNHMVEETQDLIIAAKSDNDLTKLLTEIKKMWQAHAVLLTEISHIKRRHAIDWIKEKGLLLLIPKRSNSVVCALRLPSTYPFSGEIVLESIMGHTSHVDTSDVLPPSNVSLTGWVKHLESLFGLP